MATPKVGGFKLSLAGAKGKSGIKLNPQKPVKQASHALVEEGPEDDNRQQEITGWDVAAGGAVELNGKKEEGPRIIPAQPNRNWREEAIRRRRPPPGGPPPGQNGTVVENKEEPEMTFGLTTFENKNEESEEAEPMDTTKDAPPVDDGLTEEQRLEKKALDALVNGKAEDETVIPVLSEEDAFQYDISNAPAAPTLEAYEATPVEGFGAAMLRGMGWNPNKDPAKKSKEVKRRAPLLGLGAKPEAAAGIEELGAWGKSRKKDAPTYMPLAKKNKHTGEILTEEELNARLEAQKLVSEEQPSRSSRHNDDKPRREKRRDEKDRDDYYDSERRKDKDRRKDRNDEYSDRERRREKKTSRDDEYDDSDRRREKRKYRDDDYEDSDRRREKRRDRSRDDYDRRDKGKDRDRRHRSRSPDSLDRREKRRERDRRDRSRSRDSDDRRKRRRDYDDDDRDERKRRHKDDKHYEQ